MLDQDVPNLFDLIGLGFTPLRLQVQYFFHAIPGEYVMTAFDSFFETEAGQKLA